MTSLLLCAAACLGASLDGSSIVVVNGKGTAGDYNGLRVVDVTDPFAPRVVKTIADSDKVLGAVAGDGTLYACSGGTTIMAYNITGTEPTYIGSFGDKCRNLTLANNRLLTHLSLSRWTQIVDIYNVSNPAAPQQIEYSYAWGQVWSSIPIMYAYGDYMFAAILDTNNEEADETEWHVVDLAAPGLMKGFYYQEAPNRQFLYLDGSTLYKSEGVKSDGLRAGTFTVWPASPGSPPYYNKSMWFIQYDEELGDDILRGFPVRYSYATASYRSAGGTALYPGPDGTVQGERIGDCLYLLTPSRGLSIVDVSTPTSPRRIKAVPCPAGAKRFSVSGDLVYVASSAGLSIYYAGRPKSPVLVSSTDGDTTNATAAIPYAWGCFKTTTRFLTKLAYSGGENTPSACALRCGSMGYKYAGVEFGRECWCGDGVSGSEKTASHDCKMECTGDAGEKCGGVLRVNLYSLEQPLTQPTPAYYGCNSALKTDGTRTNGVLAYVSSSNTVEECTSVCEWNGYEYAGVENGDECWCGSEYNSHALLLDAKCPLRCPGDSSEFCGNGYRANVYHLNGVDAWPDQAPNYLGCFIDNGSARTLATFAFDDASCTVERCGKMCYKKYGHNYFGLEYRSQCWCGEHPPSVSLQVDDSQCRLPCKGDRSQTCGYAYRLSVYQYA